jgi:hypothetical protein
MKVKELEKSRQTVIDKLKERRKQNNIKYEQAIDEDEFPEMYEYGAYVREDDYILNMLEGEKNERN